MLITKISPQKRKGSFNIFVDYSYSFSITEEDLVKEKLKIGLELSDKRLDELKFQGKFGLYFNKTLNFLSYRPRSEKEVLDKLKEFTKKDKDVNEQVKEELIKVVFEKVKRLGFVSDADFGKWFIEQRQLSRKPSGEFKIKRELWQKGLKKELVEELLESGTSDEGGLALQAAEKKLKAYQRLEKQEFKQKMVAFLVRQGFGFDTVLSVVDTLSKELYNAKS